MGTCRTLGIFIKKLNLAARVALKFHNIELVSAGGITLLGVSDSYQVLDPGLTRI